MLLCIIILANFEQENLLNELHRSEVKGQKSVFSSHYELVVRRKRSLEKFRITDDNLIYDQNGKKVVPTKRLTAILEQLKVRIINQTPYGEMVAWHQASEIFPKFEKADFGVVF